MPSEIAMAALKPGDMRIIDAALDMGSGYVLDFSDRTFAEFFDGEFGIDIDDPKYAANGGSKAKRLRTFIASEDDFTITRVLRCLWQHSEGIPRYQEAEGRQEVKARFFAVLTKLEGGAVPNTDGIDRFARDQTLEELVAAIERDIAANRPVAALDRLHTYCMKKFAHLLSARAIPWDGSEPLNSRVGKYVKALSQERELRDMTLQIIRNAIGIFEKFNHVRNNQSLAHDNELVGQAEARFIFDSVTAFLRFVKAIEAEQFEA